MSNRAFISMIDPGPAPLVVAVKDNIDVQGMRTTAGCEYLARYAGEAAVDAECLQGFRAARARFAGKTNLHELAFGTTGVNAWSGTPINPLGADLIPGGSSSGNAVALALGAIHIAIGTDTGGSVRIPSACCGTSGLKTTVGRISTKGVRPLAPSLDVVGPMARDIAGLAKAIKLLDANFETCAALPVAVGRLRVGEVDGRIDDAVNTALAAAEMEVLDCPIFEEEWEHAIRAVNDILWAEAAESNLDLIERWSELQSGPSLVEGLKLRSDTHRLRRAHDARQSWEERLRAVVDEFKIIASPTLECLPPSLSQLTYEKPRLARFTCPVNLAGLPAIVLPIPAGTEKLPASLQLIGPPGGESLLIAAATRIEAALQA